MCEGEMSEDEMCEGGEMCEGEMSEDEMCEGKMCEGKMCEGEMSEGEMSEGEMCEGGEMCGGEMCGVRCVRVRCVRVRGCNRERGASRHFSHLLHGARVGSTLLPQRSSHGHTRLLPSGGMGVVV